MEKITAVYEDDDLLVINKPSGIVVNRQETVKEKTLQDWIEKKFLNKKHNSYRRATFCLTRNTQTTNSKSQNFSLKDFYKRSGIVHRLDKETSGLLVVAKTPETFSNLQKQFKERKVEKRYLTLVHGRLRPKQGEIKTPISRLPWNRKRFGIFPDGKQAITQYQVIDEFIAPLGNQKITLLEVKPLTGRTHQIRVHLKYLGHPIVGDLTYGGRKKAKKDRQWCLRLFLHAFYLSFTHPESAKRMKFECPLSEDLEAVLRKLKKTEKLGALT